MSESRCFAGSPMWLLCLDLSRGVGTDGNTLFIRRHNDNVTAANGATMAVRPNCD